MVVLGPIPAFSHCLGGVQRAGNAACLRGRCTAAVRGRAGRPRCRSGRLMGHQGPGGRSTPARRLRPAGRRGPRWRGPDRRSAGGRPATHPLPRPGSYSDSGCLRHPAGLRHGPPRFLRTAPGRPSGSACSRPSPAILPVSRNTLPPYIIVKGHTCPMELPPHPVHGSRGSPTGLLPGRAAAPVPRPGTAP